MSKIREVEAYMHGVEHENDPAVKISELPAGEELQARPFQVGVTMTNKPKLARSWQYTLAGGTILLVLVVILVSVLASRTQPLKQPSHARPVSVSTSVPGTIPLLRSIPTPAGKPINSPVWSDHQLSETTADGVVYAGTVDQAVYALRSSNGSVLWHTGITGSVEELPVVLNGIVYVSSYVGQNGPAYFYALRASDGAVLWRYNDNSYIYSPTVDNGAVYIASQGDGVTALQASDGTRLWHFTTQQGSDSQISSVVNGVLYVSEGVDGQAGGVTALRASDGSVLWRYTTSNFVDMLIVSDQEIYITSRGELAALRTSDGHQLWSRVIDTTFYQSPQLLNGVIYLMTTKYILETSTSPPSQSTAVTGLAPLNQPVLATPLRGYLRSARTYGAPTPSVNGGERANAQIAGLLSQTMTIGALLSSNWSNGQASTVKETMPLKEGKSSVYAIRASDGSVLWQFPMNNGGYSFADWLQVENGVVYASGNDAENGGNTGYFYALQSSDGSLIWQDKLNGSPSGTLLSNGVIYASTGDLSGSAVYALQAYDGTFLWSYPIGGSVFNDPILVGTTIYVGAGNGMVYALRADNGALVWHYLTDVRL